MYFLNALSCFVVSAEPATSSTCRPSSSVLTSGIPTPSSSSVRSRFMYSMALAANASSWADMPVLASIIRSAIDSRGLLRALGDRLLADVDGAGVDPDLRPVLDPAEDLVADAVDQQDVRGDQDLRAQVREPAGDGFRGVDHAGHPGLDQRIRGGPVDVDLVDHHDVLVAHAVEQRLAAPGDPRHAGDAWQRA